METSSRVFTSMLGAVAATALVGFSDATATAEPPPPPSPTGSVGGVDVAITSADPLLRPGGDPMAVTVKLTNPTSAAIPVDRLVVSFGHCSCGLPGASIMPMGTMRMRDPATNTWGTAPYVVEGTGTDYLDQNLVSPFVLDPGQTITYDLQAALPANPDITAGSPLLTVTMETPNDRGHAAALRVDVEP